MNYNSSYGYSNSVLSSNPVELHHLNSLERSNYLSEYTTEIDKARVRKNLGIPDDYTMTWENIKGMVENNKQIMELFNSIDRRLSKLEANSPMPAYMGYAKHYTLILGNKDFGLDSVDGIWNSSNIKLYEEFPELCLWIITSKKIESIIQLGYPFNLECVTITYSNVNYNVYYIGPLDSNEGEFKITTY